MGRWVIFIGAMLGAAGLGACARDAAEVDAGRDGAGARFSAGERILSGFEIGPDPAMYRSGDCVLIGLRLERGSEVREKYLLITLRGDFTVTDSTMSLTNDQGAFEARIDSYFAAARVYDGAGTELSHTTLHVPAVCLSTGLFDYASMLIEAASWDEAKKAAVKTDRVWRERATRAFMTLILQGGMLRDTKELNDLLEGVVQRPGVFDAVFGGGFSIKDGTPARRGEPVKLGGTAPLESTEVSEEFVYGWTLLGRLSGTFVPCAPPLGLCGGLVEGVADNPGHGPRVEVKLLAAKRGDGAPWKPATLEFVGKGK